MPTFPTLPGPQVAPTVPNLPAAHAPGPAAYGYGLGSGLVQAGNALAQAEADEKRRINASAVMSAYADALSLRSDIMYGEKFGLARQSGQNYLDALNPASEAWDKGIDSIGARLTPEQQYLFADRIESLRARMSDDVRSGASRARIEKYDADQSKITTETMRTALEGVQNGGVYIAEDGSLSDEPTQAALDDFYAEGGILDAYAPHMAEKWGVPEADARQKMAEEFTYALHAQAISELLAGSPGKPGDPKAADAYYEKYRDQIPPERRQPIEDDLARGVSAEVAAETGMALWEKHYVEGVTPSEAGRLARAETDDPKVRSEITRMETEERGSLARVAQDAESALSEKIRTLPHSDVPGGQSFSVVEGDPRYRLVDGAGQRALREEWDFRQSGGYATTSPESIAWVNDKLNDPAKLDEFMRIDFTRWTKAGKMSKDDAERFTKIQDGIRKGQADALKGARTVSGIVSGAAARLKPKDGQRAEREQIEADLDALIVTEQVKLGRQLTPAEADAIVAPIFEDVVYKDRFLGLFDMLQDDDMLPLREVAEDNDIPYAEALDIVRTLRDGGKLVNDETIVAAYKARNP